LQSVFFVIGQFAALAAILVTGPLVPPGWALRLIELAGLTLGIWAVLSMSLENFSIAPDPKLDAQLVARGPYATIRHPMYTALLVFTLGLVLAVPTPLRIALWFALLIDLLLKMNYEEKLLVAVFPEYRGYKARTHKLIPFIY
jgi:protein-S-isoprenylcysteine O-methyltransferase Ste14